MQDTAVSVYHIFGLARCGILLLHQQKLIQLLACLFTAETSVAMSGQPINVSKPLNKDRTMQ